MVDPIEELAHDHHELSGLLIALHDAIARVERGQSELVDELHEIRDGVEAFRESLLEHFAREQEGLLPFVVMRVPRVRERADQLIVEHDRIAEALTALVQGLAAVESGAPLDPWRAMLVRFEELYAAHTKGELSFLADVARSLSGDHEATAQLRQLLDEP